MHSRCSLIRLLPAAALSGLVSVFGATSLRAQALPVFEGQSSNELQAEYRAYLMSAVQEWSRAWMDSWGRAGAMEEHYARDGLLVTPRPPARVGYEAIASFMDGTSARLASGSVFTSDLDGSQNVALVRGRYEVGGASGRDRGEYFLVLRQDRFDWNARIQFFASGLDGRPQVWEVADTGAAVDDENPQAPVRDADGAAVPIPEPGPADSDFGFFVEAWNERDAERAGALITDDVWVRSPLAEFLEGRRDVEARLNPGGLGFGIPLTFEAFDSELAGDLAFLTGWYALGTGELPPEFARGVLLAALRRDGDGWRVRALIFAPTG